MLARDGVSREVPCSALKGETVPDSLPATPKSPPTRRVPPRGLLISRLQSPSEVILEPPKIKSVSPSIRHEVMGPDAMIFLNVELSIGPPGQSLSVLKTDLIVMSLTVDWASHFQRIA